LTFQPELHPVPTVRWDGAVSEYADAEAARRWTGCSLQMYNRLTERCFRECVDSFRRKAMDSTEERVRFPPTPTTKATECRTLCGCRESPSGH
jgi:hypothetical protein